MSLSPSPTASIFAFFAVVLERSLNLSSSSKVSALALARESLTRPVVLASSSRTSLLALARLSFDLPVTLCSSSTAYPLALASVSLTLLSVPSYSSRISLTPLFQESSIPWVPITTSLNEVLSTPQPTRHTSPNTNKLFIISPDYWN